LDLHECFAARLGGKLPSVAAFFVFVWKRLAEDSDFGWIREFFFHHSDPVTRFADLQVSI